MSEVIPIRLSHSTLDLIHDCARKFQLEKLLANPMARDETEHTVFGKAYGVGIATYFVTQDTDQALFQAWYSYWPEIETDKKNQPRLFAALMSSFIEIDTLLMEYEVASFNGKPAVELSFRLNISKEYYFVGYVDLVLRNRLTGVHYIVDAKTTGLAIFDLSPLYKHSGQALGYSIALDRIVGERQSSYGVMYFVAQLGKDFRAKIHILSYDKSLLDRLNWFISLGLQVERLGRMAELGFYPLEYQSCLKYNRACKYFGSCHLHSLDFPAQREEDVIQYDFVYELDDLVEDHLARIKENPLLAADSVSPADKNKELNTLLDIEELA